MWTACRLARPGVVSARWVIACHERPAMEVAFTVSAESVRGCWRGVRRTVQRLSLRRGSRRVGEHRRSTEPKPRDARSSRPAAASPSLGEEVPTERTGACRPRSKVRRTDARGGEPAGAPPQRRAGVRRRRRAVFELQRPGCSGPSDRRGVQHAPNPGPASANHRRGPGSARVAPVANTDRPDQLPWRAGGDPRRCRGRHPLRHPPARRSPWSAE